MSSSPIRYRAGAASECVTPDEPLWLAGYAVRTSPARGNISDLYASALALEDENGQRFVIASIDLIAITPAISTSVFEQLGARHGLRRERVLLTATHTHYGPEFRVDKQLFFNISDEFAGQFREVSIRLAAAIVRVIEQALQR
ncbi:MAG TPA: neutral/alkaline non-lysosomal ceramidase N-terminal domain-containing protein, partial [Lacipirellulaceae bacterium]|nr:neutral/alkaline non-lysosomal ceramidase N-terminal domain-containing protein [Lacipirellulaceae bacterium]